MATRESKDLIEKDLLQNQETDLVLTPGGPRPRSKVTRVGSAQTVLQEGEAARTVQVAGHRRAFAEAKRAQGLVLTPGGFRHPSLVHRVEQGHGVTMASGASRMLDLSTGETLDLKATPRHAGVTPSLGTGWITDARFTKSPGMGPVTLFRTIWKVPPAPKSSDGQTIFLFNAMEDAGLKDILQPVLQWGPSDAGGDDYWSISPWFIDPSGNAFYRDLIRVEEGDVLVGVMQLTGQSGSSFNYDCFFEGFAEATLTVTNTSEQTVLFETLECYSIDNCADYPQTFYTAMTAIDIESGGASIEPQWTIENKVTDCGQHTNIVSNLQADGEVDLFYTRTAPRWHLQRVTGGLSKTFGPPATEPPAISVFGEQQHFCYRDAGGAVWDVWYDGGNGSWNLQRINNNGLTDGALAQGRPFVCVFNEQQHFTYRDALGSVVDAWYDQGGDNWSLQTINIGGVTTGNPAAGEPFVCAFNQQQHFTYRDAKGFLFDAWYDGGGNNWSLQQLNMGGKTFGTAAAGDPFVCVFNEQQHFAYRDPTGVLLDAWYDSGSSGWNLQQINLGGRTNGGPAAGDPFVCVFGQQQHFTYRDATGILLDAWYDSDGNSWNLQQINMGGKTNGPAASTDAFVSVFGAQQHFGYRDSTGNVWDAWYDSGKDAWNIQQVNDSGLTSGPTAAAGPGISVYGEQQHFAYLDNSGAIRDAWYDLGSNAWNIQQLTAGGLTDGPAAAGDPFVSVYGQQQHIGYRDANGTIWDAWYDGGSNSWNLQTINSGGRTNGNPAAVGPDISVYGEQQHFGYSDFNETIWDSWYDSGDGSWKLQQINESGLTGGPATIGIPVISVYGEQQHFVYRDGGGTLWDSWYDSGGKSWNLQQINDGGLTSAPPAVGDPSVFVYGQQQHFVYHANDDSVWDCWYDSGTNTWKQQQITVGGLTTAPATAGDPFGCAFGQQEHVTYRDATGNIWDCWYDSGTNAWKQQQITAGGGLTIAPTAFSDPFVCVFGQQQHFAYRDADGTIWDCWFDGDHDSWERQQINAGSLSNSGVTVGPVAMGGPFVWGYGGQEHFTYRDSEDNIWDSWYEG